MASLTDTGERSGKTVSVRRAAPAPLRPSRRGAHLWLALALACTAGPARAEEERASADEAAEEREDKAAGRHSVLFSSLEAAASTFSTTGAKLAFDRFDRDGPVALVSAGTGMRLEGGGRLPVLVRTTVLGAALGGYQFARPWGVVALLAGPEISAEMLSGADGALLLPIRPGLRLHGEIWARPTEATLATATVILGSARGDAWARLSWGMALFGAYLGPEASLYADRAGYRKWALGLHATDVALGGYRFRLSAGCQFEGAAGAPAQVGPYLGLTIWNAF